MLWYLKKAVITNMDTNEEIEVMFNPKEYVVEKKTPWSEINVFGLDSPPCAVYNGREKTAFHGIVFRYL